jgi:UPF0755 protein
MVGVRWWYSPGQMLEQSEVVVVAPGASMSRIADNLEQAGLIRSPSWFAVMARLTGADRAVRAGHYKIDGEMSPRALMRLLISGEAHSYRVTLVEGKTFAELLEVIQSHPNVISELSGANDPWVLETFAGANGPEGWLFPDTYYFPADTSDKALLLRSYAAMQQNLTAVWDSRSKGSPLTSAYDALILASIIEKETSVASERADIAGVFVRRLQKNMRLQTDPTIIYGLGDLYDGDITRAHLRDKRNRYNTYQHPGLPPTPIASPGLAALEAAVHPRAGTTLYFVADGRGGHVFSETLAEHKRAVRTYLNTLQQ